MTPAEAEDIMLAHQRLNAEDWTNWDATLRLVLAATRVTEELERAERDRILALQTESWEREIALDVAAARERCAKLCDQRSADHWHDFKDIKSPFRGLPSVETRAYEAEQCGEAIRAAAGSGS